MKKIKSLLLAIFVILVPGMVFASSSDSSDMSIGLAIRNGSICIDTYVSICTNAIV